MRYRDREVSRGQIMKIIVSLWGSTTRAVRESYFWFLWPHCVACGILVPQPGTKPAPPAVEAQSLNHWTTREVPRVTLGEQGSDVIRAAGEKEKITLGLGRRQSKTEREHETGEEDTAESACKTESGPRK